jgi:AraC-like DNA-binding protein
MNPNAPISGAVNRLWTPRASLSSCVRAAICRDARSSELDAWQRLSYFPATPLCSISWWFAGHGERVHGPFPEREATPDDPREPFASTLLVGGPFSMPSVSYSAGDVHGMMLMLMPDALRLLTGIEPATIVNRLVDGNEVLPASWLDWARSLPALPDDVARCDAIDAFLDPLWQAARPDANALGTRYGDWTTHLATRAAMTAPGRTLRQVERLVKRWAGQPMRELQGISKLEQAFYARVAAERDDDARWADIAADCGYADQSHLTRATRRMTGFPPEDLRRRIREQEGFWAYRAWM